MLGPIPKQESLLESRCASRGKKDVTGTSIHAHHFDEALSLYRREVSGQCRSFQTEDFRKTMQRNSSSDARRDQDGKLRASQAARSQSPIIGSCHCSCGQPNLLTRAGCRCLQFGYGSLRLRHTCKMTKKKPRSQEFKKPGTPEVPTSCRQPVEFCPGAAWSAMPYATPSRVELRKPES